MFVLLSYSRMIAIDFSAFESVLTQQKDKGNCIDKDKGKSIDKDKGKSINKDNGKSINKDKGKSVDQDYEADLTTAR